ncbi:MAG: hypothetical protein HC842_00015 [Cytophagales bacterium]|nr:hypothetical protein [Cytophagales bacterium]
MDEIRFGGSYADVTPKTPDAEAPSVPTGLAASNRTVSDFTLSWAASTDNLLMKGYKVYLEGNFYAETDQTSLLITGLESDTDYSMTVSAVDHADNESAASEPLVVRTAKEGLPSLTANNTQVFVGSGENFALLSNITDNSPGEPQAITLSATSSNPALIEILGVDYNPADAIALVRFLEKGSAGTASITIEISDEDGIGEASLQVDVVPYYNPGFNFKVIDSEFWKGVTDPNANAAYTQLIDIARTPTDVNWSNIELTVSAECKTIPPCNGQNDFATFLFIGYVTPPQTGAYTFRIEGPDSKGLWLSPDADYGKAVSIARNGSTTVGTVSGNGVNSAAQQLEKGKVYAIYGFIWRVHSTDGGIKWSGPGLTGTDYIGGDYSYAVYDTEKPSIPQNLQILSTASDKVQLSWSASTDNQRVEGYNLYRNGSKINTELLTSTSYLAEGLDAGTLYSFVVTAADEMGNESLPSHVASVETYPVDNTPPLAPTGLTVIKAAGLALQIAWNPAQDNETAIFGYNVYVDDVLFNEGYTVLDTAIILSPLAVETTYSIKIEAIDAGGNMSEASFQASTTKLDPSQDNLGVKTGRLDITTEAISTSRGIGINANYENRQVFDAAHTELLGDLQPGAIRWGAIDANDLSFSTFSGAGKSVTLGEFITRCTEFNALANITCGVDTITDWMSDKNTFLRFLEYINGPDNTPGGKLRVAEGYTEPFLKNSPGLIFEFGNEVWGGSSKKEGTVDHHAPIGENYADYRDWCREVALLMKQSPYYDSSKIVLVASTRYPNLIDSYGLNDYIIQGDTGLIDWTGPSGYLGGNLTYDPAIPAYNTELQYYRGRQQYMFQQLSGMVNSKILEISKAGRPMPMYLYESNTTTPDYKGVMGQAIISTDYYLTAMEKGAAMASIFHLTGGEWRITAPEDNYRRLPLFQTAKYVNRLAKGDVLKSSYFSSDLLRGPGGSFINEASVSGHAYRTQEGYRVILVSRDFENDYYVQVNWPDDLPLSGTGKMYVIGAADFSTTNTQIDTMGFDIKDSLVVRVPKHAMVALDMGGEVNVLDDLALGHFDYVRQSTISILSEDLVFDRTGQRVVVQVESSPANALVQSVKWELLGNNGTFALLGTQANSRTIRCDKLDVDSVVILRARQWTIRQFLTKLNLEFKSLDNPCSLPMQEKTLLELSFTRIQHRNLFTSTYLRPPKSGY